MQKLSIVALFTLMLAALAVISDRGTGLFAVNDSYHALKLYMDLRNEDEPSERDPAISNPQTRKRLCRELTDHGLQSVTEFESLDSADEFEALRRDPECSEFFNQVYTVASTDNSSYEYVNAYTQAFFFGADNDHHIEYVFVCVLTDERSDSIIPYFVSKEYNVGAEGLPYKPGRFIFHGAIFLPSFQPGYVVLAEEPAVAYTEPDFDVELYFLRVRKHIQSEYEWLKKFEGLDNLSKHEATVENLASAVSFSLPQDRQDYVTEACAFLLVARLKAPRSAFNNELTFLCPQGVRHKASAQIYPAKGEEESWAIAPGFHEGVLIVFNRPYEKGDFRLFGLLEKPPEILAGMTQRELETRFATGHMVLGGEAKEPTTRRSLCKLSDFERFRLCSVAYIQWNYSGKVTNAVWHVKGAEGNYVDLKNPANKPKCLEDVVWVDLEDEQTSIPADVISCAINKDAMHADFFLTADRFSDDSIFKLRPLWEHDDSSYSQHSIDDTTTGYILELFMTNVRVLKPFPIKQGKSSGT